MFEHNKQKIDGGLSTMKTIRNPFILAFVILLVTALIWGCAKMEGERHVKQPPTVAFVNTPKDANFDSVTITSIQNMPFNLFWVVEDTATGDTFHVSLYDTVYKLVNFPEVVVEGDTLRVTAVPNEPFSIKSIEDGVTTYYDEGTDYSITDYSTLEIQVIDTAQGGSMDAQEADGDTIIYYADFKISTPNYYVFSYAPSVHWQGTDPDGFVEQYYYADIEYDDVQAQLGIGANPADYISLIAPSDWDSTLSNSATIYLLTETGVTTEHIIYLKCRDNDGLFSPIVLRTFFRSNRPPNTPEVKWDEHPDDRYNTIGDIRTEEDSSGYIYDNTLFCLPGITPIWSGIIFRWRGNDSDDVELYTIPLTYQYFLYEIDENDEPVRVIWDYSTGYSSEATSLEPDTTWFTEDQSVTIVDLDSSGSYMLTVWSFDDGFESSPDSGMIKFKCVVPPPEAEKNSIILYDETTTTPPPPGLVELPDNAIIDSFYVDMLNKMDPLFDTKEYDFEVDDIYDTSGTQDVMYWDNSKAETEKIIPIEKLANYKLVIMYADDHKHLGTTVLYRSIRDLYFSRYLEAGGRLWVIGRCLFNGSFGEYAGVQYTQNELLNMMQVEQIYVYRWPSNQPFEFIGAFNAVDFLDTLQINQDLVNSLSFVPADTGLPEVDWMGRDEDATTLYYFNSITGAQTEVFVEDGVGYVMDDSARSGLYPWPSGSECWVIVDTNSYKNLIEVTSVINWDKMAYGNGVGEVEVVTSDDDIKVNYAYIDTVYEEYADVLPYPTPTQTACYIRTSHYDQDFTEGIIYNQSKDSYGTAGVINLDSLQVNYLPDTATVADVVVLTEADGQFDPTPDSCAVRVSTLNLVDVFSVTNITRNQTGAIMRQEANIVIVSTQSTWATTDSLEASISYFQYIAWEVGDSVWVEYASDIYWERGDSVTVDFSCNPMSDAHLKPCAIRYEYYEVYNYTFIVLYYRTAVFTFPLSFMQNTNGEVDELFENMLDWFLYPSSHVGE